MKRILARVVWVALLALGLAQGGVAAPSMPPAGTRIPNQASGTYTEANTTRPPQPSNRVEVEVQSFVALTLVRDQSVRLPAGARASLGHVLTNVGNVRTQYVVEARNLGGDGYDLSGLALVQGQAGPPVNTALTVTLDPGASVDLMLSGTVPAGTPDGAVAKVEVVAQSQDGAARAANVDQVQVDGSIVAPTINYFSNSTFSQPTSATRLGEPLYVQVQAIGCNLDPQVAETIEVSLRSQLTGDVEVFQATETGPDTGIFRILPAVPTLDGSAGPLPGDGILQTVERDTVVAREECSGFEVTAEILVDPYGVVFDSGSNQPVPGASVTLVDVTGNGNGGNAGGPARVLEDDGVTPAPSTVVTGADGTFRFPLVAASTYRLAVQPPAGYGFPSVVPPGQLPPGRAIDVQASYGASFPLTAALGAFKIDVPLDPGPASGLFLEKSSNRQVVELGEFLEYSVVVSNGSGQALSRLCVSDELPAGFEYVPGTARRDKAPLADPSGSPGPHLEFDLGALGAGAKVTLVYRVRVGPGTTVGDRSNRAQAAATTAGGTLFSNTGVAKVRVEPGVFPDRGVLIGKVFVDRNGNRRPDPDEPGIPTVRLFLEDGTFVITDREGKYSLYGLQARTHVLRVDRSTLPEGAVMGEVSQRNAGDPYSMFVDLKKGELFRADFREVSGTAELLAEVEARRKSDGPLEGGALLQNRLDPDAVPATNPDTRALPSAGMIGVSGPVPMQSTPPRGQGLASRNSNLPDPPVSSTPPSAGQALEGLTNQTGFVDLADGDILAAPQANVRVKGLLGTSLRLSLNGQALPESRVGSRSTVADKQLQVWEFIGVDFRPGENELVLEQVDGFGNVRETVRLKVTAPGSAGGLKLEAPAGTPQADGRTPVMIAVLVTDQAGLPVQARTPVTLESDAGRWDVQDGNPREPGVQVFVSGGRTEFALLPPVEPGTVRVRVSSGLMKADLDLVFTTELRPLFVTGVVDGGLDFRRTRTGDVRPDEIGNLVEDELDRFGRPDEASSRADLRGSVYIKGDIGNGYGLTMAYDSQKERDLRMFRDIQPDQYFPIYGDASVKGFDAVSTSPFYMRLDRERNYLLYGDFVTATPDAGQGLGTYYRSLTGGKLHLEGDGYRANLFGTRSSSNQVVLEIPANGTSGPYALGSRFPKVNSERVEIVVRDRNQPSVILQSRGATRFSDYAVDYQFGGILFRQPVQSLDANLNPVFVRITYEVQGGGPVAWIYGGDARFRVADGVTVGGTFAREDQVQDPYQLWSANVGVDLTDDTHLTAEVAGTRRQSLGSGSANRFELVHDGGAVQARAFVGRTDPTFDNPTSILSRGRSESGLKASWQVDEDTGLMGEALRSRDTGTGAELSGYQLAVIRRLRDGLNLEIAYRRAVQTNGPAQADLVGAGNVDLSTLRAKLSGQIPGVPEATAFLEYEQDLRDASRRALSVGGDYQFAERARIYARHELISSLGNRYTLNDVQRDQQTVFGVDADYMDGGHVFSEYRVRDALSGREGEAALGLRNAFQVADGLRLNTTLERLVASPQGQDGTSVTGALEYTGSEDFKGTARLEYRNQGGQVYLLRTVGAAWRVSPDMSVLLRDVSDRAQGQAGKRSFERTQLGMAWRPAEGGPWNGLLKVERRAERDDLASQLRRQVALLSLAVNYQPEGPARFSAFYAGKLADETSDGISTSTSAHMVGGRVVWELSQRWDVGVTGARFFGSGDQGDQHTLGLELGYLLRRDMWLSAGYNFVGFDDQDFGVENYTSQGPYIRLRFKFGTDDFGSDEPGAQEEAP